MNVKILLPAVAAAELCALSGCGPVGAKSTSMAVIYSATAVLAVNTGYLPLALSPTLGAPLWANRVSYLGSVLLPMAMQMILLNGTGLRYEKWLPLALLVYL